MIVIASIVALYYSECTGSSRLQLTHQPKGAVTSNHFWFVHILLLVLHMYIRNGVAAWGDVHRLRVNRTQDTCGKHPAAFSWKLWAVCFSRRDAVCVEYHIILWGCRREEYLSQLQHRHPYEQDEQEKSIRPHSGRSYSNMNKPQQIKAFGTQKQNKKGKK